MKAFIGNIEDQAKENYDFRQVIFTTPHLQLVLMSLEPGQDIGEEVHEGTDQFFRVEEGKGEIVVNGHPTRIDDDTAIVIPAGTRHNIRNTGKKPLKMYTLYSPPQHPAGTVHKTKADAVAAEPAGAHG